MEARTCGIAGSDYDGVLLAPSSSGAGVGATVAAGEGGAGAGLEPPPGLGAGAGAGSTPVISADAQAVQAAEAERMAQQLLEVRLFRLYEGPMGRQCSLDHILF